MRYITILFFLFISFYSYSQIPNPVDTLVVQDSLLTEQDTIDIPVWKEYKIQPYVGLQYEISPIQEEQHGSFGGEIGVIIKNHWIVGLYALELQTEYLERIIFPNDFRLAYKHGGLLLGITTSSQRALDFSFIQRVGFGDVLWQYDISEVDFVKDNIVFLNPNIGVDLNLIGLSKIHFSLGYRKAIGLDITGMNSGELDGITTNIIFKIGRFNKWSK